MTSFMLTNQSTCSLFEGVKVFIVTELGGIALKAVNACQTVMPSKRNSLSFLFLGGRSLLNCFFWSILRWNRDFLFGKHVLCQIMFDFFLVRGIGKCQKFLMLRDRDFISLVFL
jgi:hypothetical protein